MPSEFAPPIADPMRRRLLQAIGGSALLAAAGCASDGLMFHDHPLVGRVFDLGSRRMVAAPDTLAQLDRADVVLLGETHDNPVHHQLQLELLRALSTSRPRVLAMEQFDVENQAALAAAQSKAGRNAESLADEGGLSRQGWGWPLYRPLVAEALARNVWIVGINLSRKGAREVARGGFDAMPAGPARDIVESVWSPQREERLERLITIGHCHQISPEVLAMVVRAQRARDAVMAQAIAPPPGRSVVAILGRGHARKDLAVPIYLERMQPQSRVLSVGLVEVDEGLTDAGAYEEIREQAFDLAWFTPRFVRPDPCAAMTAAKMHDAMKK